MRTKQTTRNGKGLPEKPSGFPTFPEETSNPRFKPVESTADFKERLKSTLPREARENDRKQRPCVRTPSDKGFYPPTRTRACDERAQSGKRIGATMDEQILLDALNDVELRTAQARIVSGIGKRKNQTEFLLGELERIGKVARAAIDGPAQSGGGQ